MPSTLLIRLVVFSVVCRFAPIISSQRWCCIIGALLARYLTTLDPMLSDSTIDLICKFSDDRDWNKFHTQENLAKSVSIEAAELLECYQWSGEARDGDLEHVHEELADVIIYCVMLADKMNLSLDNIVRDKLAKNCRKYPVSKAFGKSVKYTEL
jgi:NTP pyrophosphatase (non-canonical NTP hydrolase)